MLEYHGPPSRIAMYQHNMNRQGIGAYYVRESQLLRSFFAMVDGYVPPGSRLLEVGYGPGTLGIYLSRFGFNVVGVDWDPDVVELARMTNERLDGKVDFQVRSLSEIDKTFGRNSFDAVISDVTMEHFCDQDIITILRKELFIAKLNIFAVHCDNILPEYIKYLDGGERLHSPSYWENLIEKAGGIVIDRFGYGFSVTRIGKLNWRIQRIAEDILFKRLARFAAATGFVVKRK